jgi:hypothetical protein
MDSPRRKSPRAFLVYGGVLLLLVVIAMLARGFSRDVGDARVAGRYSVQPLFQSRTPEELALTWNGLTLHFTRSMTPALQGFESAQGSTDIVFDGGARLRVTPGTDTGGSVSLVPVGAGGAAAASVVVPFSLEGVVQDPPPAGAVLAWKRAGRTYLLSMPSGGSSDPEAGTLTLPLAGAAAAVLQVQGVVAAARAAGAPVAVASARMPREADMPGDDKVQAALAAWLDAAWQGWSSSRYTAADGSWRLVDGTRGFSEDIGVPLLAESIARGTWQATFSRWSDALARARKTAPTLTLVSSAYIGGVRDFAAARQAAAGAEAARAAAALGRSDGSALLIPGLVTLLLDHGSPDLVQQAGAYLAGRSAAGLDLPSSLGLAADLLDYGRLVRPDDAMARLLRETVEKRILLAVRATDSGVFLDSGAGTSDVQVDLTGGALLLRAGTALGSTLASAVGRGLLVSSLALADDAGFLPATVGISGGHMGKPQGSIAPETIYPLLPLTRFVPRETPLAAQVGGGAWAWTSARLSSVTGSPAGVTLQLSYPRGIPYHVVLKGLPPFTLLKLHGIPWHSDPTYFTYSDGWSYDPASRTLFMKITGRVDPEVIDITY